GAGPRRAAAPRRRLHSDRARADAGRWRALGAGRPGERRADFGAPPDLELRRLHRRRTDARRGHGSYTAGVVRLGLSKPSRRRPPRTSSQLMKRSHSRPERWFSIIATIGPSSMARLLSATQLLERLKASTKPCRPQISPPSSS